MLLFFVFFQNQEIMGQVGVMQDASNSSDTASAWQDLPWYKRLLIRSCNYTAYNEIGVEEWWTQYFNGSITENGSNNSNVLERVLEAAKNSTLVASQQQENDTSNMPVAKPPSMVDADEIVEPRRNPILAIQTTLESICFIDDPGHNYLYECSVDHRCDCMKSPVVTFPVNEGGFVQCRIGENNLCVSKSRPNKPYNCDSELYCDLGNTNLCLHCTMNDTHRPTCTKMIQAKSRGGSWIPFSIHLYFLLSFINTKLHSIFIHP